MKKLLILAGSTREATDFATEHNIPVNSCMLATPASLKGLSNPAYVIVGTFWERYDAIDVWRTLQTSMVLPPLHPLPLPASVVRRHVGPGGTVGGIETAEADFNKKKKPKDEQRITPEPKDMDRMKPRDDGKRHFKRIVLKSS